MASCPADNPDVAFPASTADAGVGRYGGTCILEARGLGVARGGRRVIHDVSLIVRQDECLSIVGPNGSGKSTLLLALLGRLPPASGTVLAGGRALRSLPARERGRLLGYVPQSLPAAPPLAVRDVVAGGRYPHRGRLQRLSADDRAAIQRAIEMCGLGALTERLFGTLSGGERQKALIAAAIAQEPRALLLDEPGTGLDPGYQIELVRILHGWHAAGRASVMVSHDLALAAAVGGRVVALRDGRVAADGAAEDVLRPEVLGRVYGAAFSAAATVEGRQFVVPAWWQGKQMSC